MNCSLTLYVHPNYRKTSLVLTRIFLISFKSDTNPCSLPWSGPRSPDDSFYQIRLSESYFTKTNKIIQ